MLDEFIHNYIPARRADAVTLLVLHGTGGDENDLVPLAQMIDRDAGVLSPRGRVLERGMPRFFRRLAEGVFDQEDLRVRTGELANFIAEAAAHYGFELTKVFAVGYSNGANIAASVLLSRPETLAGGILFRVMMPFEPERPPDLSTKKIFVSAGRQDQMISASLTEKLVVLLKEARAEVTVNWLNTGHGLVRADIDAAAEWFRENVLVQPNARARH